MSCYGSVTNCTDCIKPYSLDVNFTCQICIPSSCEKCSTNLALCESCLSPYSYIPSAGVCYRCEQAFVINVAPQELLSAWNAIQVQL